MDNPYCDPYCSCRLTRAGLLADSVLVELLVFPPAEELPRRCVGACAPESRGGGRAEHDADAEPLPGDDRQDDQHGLPKIIKMALDHLGLHLKK